MLPLHSLLNPASPGRSVAVSRQSSPALETSPIPFPTEALQISTNATLAPRANRSANVNRVMTMNLQGPINFAPFEDIDQTSYQEMSRFSVASFGQIQQSCEHIPYNSSKKDFFEKTGRESIEVFKYEFRLPGEEKTYTIMWDYNVGLVRMTPFFKCQGYPKTKTSQMLDKNPGLRDISPSVTGGAVSAQGYWMPYRCARAVCATFCVRIAGALIPLFGPSFPAQCTPVDSPGYKEMVISQRTIIEATEDVERFRRGQRNRIIEAVGGPAGSLGFESYASFWTSINEADASSSLTQPSPPQSFWNSVNEADASSSLTQPSHPQSFWTPVKEADASSSLTMPSHPQSFWTPVKEADASSSLTMPSPPQSFWTPINKADASRRPVAALAQSTAYEAREGTALAYQYAPGRDPSQTPTPFLTVPPTSGSERKPVESCSLKRPRRARDEPRTAYPSSPRPVETNARSGPQVDLEQFMAAVALMNLRREAEAMGYFPTAVADSSDDDDVSEPRHQKKRPKAHSF
ncbi:hypothetical protein Trco_003950 [Trichoderma cornu-damae]|uniref:HTH APSES-type domain-containing protein n=1 Tax=Trichoderma cornu-damae TaxID=654480 RepID=A0A9P8QS57_9HYPO|nr:hypothetical protein Trco_003950 [Trichoderma cornu-damae]